MNKRILMFIFISLLPFHSWAQSASSIRLADVVSKGYGEIDLLMGQGNSPINPSVLEALRLDNQGDLVLGVDVNEAASGSEKASTQGVAVEYVTLTLQFNDGAQTYSTFTTETQSLLAISGQETRQEYYTLIGHAGSNNITGSTLNNTSFDSTLRIPVDRDISLATAANLVIKFLDTNSSLGDPEEFYDYSNGFEDLAILNYPDTTFLDEQAAGREEAPLVILTNEQTEVVASYYSPSAQAYFVVAYEDEYPQKGDYDVNDLVVAYRIEFGLDNNGNVKTISGDGYLVARGGLYSHDWHLRIPFNTNVRSVGQFFLYSPEDNPNSQAQINAIDVSSDLDITIFSDTRNLFVDPTNPFVNTMPDSDLIRGDKFSFSITLENSIAINQLGAAPFDPYLVVHTTGYEVHLPDYAPVNSQSNNVLHGHTDFVDDQGFPFAFIFPEDWRTPLEFVDVGNAYPSLIDFIQSDKSTATTWYLDGVEGLISNNSSSNWQW